MDQGDSSTWKRDASYIPQQACNGSNTTIVFSLQDSKGALARALKLFEVKARVCGCVKGVTLEVIFSRSVDLRWCHIVQGTGDQYYAHRVSPVKDEPRERV